MTKLSKIIDFVFGTAFVFLTTFVWARYFVHDFWLTLLLTSAITFSIVGLYHFIKQRHDEKINLTKQELNKASSCTRLFMLSNKKETLNTLYGILSTKYQVTKKPNFLYFNNIVFKPVYSSLKIKEEDVLDAFTQTKSLNPKKIILCSKSIEPAALQLASSIKQTKIILLNEQEFFYSVLKPLGFECGKTDVKESRAHRGWKSVFQIVFHKSRAKGYALSAFILLALSFLLRYNLYYIIMASLLALFSLFSYFNRPFNQIKKEELLL